MTLEIKRLRALLKETDDPGPWKHGSRNGGYECVRNANGDLVAKMGGIGAPAKKRARVIASLPLLLDVAEAAGRYIAAVDAEEGQAIALASLRTALARLEGVE